MVGPAPGPYKLSRAGHRRGAAHEVEVAVLDLADQLTQAPGIAVGLRAVRVLHRLLVRRELDPEHPGARPVAVLHHHRLPVPDRPDRLRAPFGHELEERVVVGAVERQRLDKRHWDGLLSGSRKPVAYSAGTTATAMSSTL